uniref:DNA-(apurinic or apyrimidinic site) endonuclease n=1 Tax=Chenopodium quinoa TaxID=63459 RepID=A0A803KQF8_CHEQI
MKRFFQPIQKDGSSKKPALSTKEDNEEEERESKDDGHAKEPLKLLTWNANSLLLRAKNNWPEFSKLVSYLDPDIIAIQEVRMPAAGSKGASKNQGELKDDTNASREENKCFYDNHPGVDAGPFKSSIWKLSCAVVSSRFQVCWDCIACEEMLQAKKDLLLSRSFSHEDIDVSHPDFFAAAKMNGYIPPNKEDCGQPGFTISERKRFGTMLREGKLEDAYRFLHKEKDMECGFSWSGNPVGKYRGKRMRIDYFLVSEMLKDRIVSCKMHGQGIELEGFCGSDHCPLSLELAPSSPDPTLNEASN